MMKKILDSYCKTNKLLSICADPEDQDAFSVGYVLFTNDQFCLINALDAEGRREGVKVRKLDDIIVVEEGGEYERNIEKLASEIDDENKGKIAFVPKFNDLFGLLAELCLKKVRVDIYYGNPEFKYTGVVNLIEDGVVKVDKEDDDGNSDGVAFLVLDNIQGIDYYYFFDNGKKTK